MSEFTRFDKPTHLNEFLAPAYQFVRSINVKLDLDEKERIAHYLPTHSAAVLTTEILQSIGTKSNHRVRTIIGPYGVGKSAYALYLLSLLSKKETNMDAVRIVSERFQRDFPGAGEASAQWLSSGDRFLPVVLSGYEGDICTALNRALKRSLATFGFPNLVLPTAFSAAVNTIENWKREYPDTYRTLQEKLKESHFNGTSELLSAIEHGDIDALSFFSENIYPQLTSGATFDTSSGVSPDVVYQHAAESIRQHGYRGIFVLYDEFGRFLERLVSDPHGFDSKLLQDFAEMCDRTSEAQVHLLLVTHKSIGDYLQPLDKNIRDEWAKIEGRFRNRLFASDANIILRLISEAITVTDEKKYQAFKNENSPLFDEALNHTVALRLFDGFPVDKLRESVIEGTYPLHPLTTALLPRLSEQVAQNERTLFAFLTSNEKHGLRDFIQNGEVEGFPVVRPAQLYDFFSSEIKHNTGRGGVHNVWSDITNTLKHIEKDDEFLVELVKTIGVFFAAGLNSQLTPTPAMLTFALGATSGEAKIQLENALSTLIRKKLLIYRRSASYYEFKQGSDVDYEQEIARVVQERRASLRPQRLLDRLFQPKVVLPRGYNDEKAMVRYFTARYVLCSTLSPDMDWDAELLEGQEGDGLVYYVIPTNSAEVREAVTLAQNCSHPQIIFAVPKSPLEVLSPLTELETINILTSEPQFTEQDERIEGELAFFAEDIQRQITSILQAHFEPSANKCQWINHGQTPAISSRFLLSRYVSHVCEQVFYQTPHINNDAFNQHTLTPVQNRAARQVIDALFAPSLEANLGFSGSGPEAFIMRSALHLTGLLELYPPSVHRPDEAQFPEMAEVWDAIDGFLQKAKQAPQPFEHLIYTLIRPPYGLRKGVLGVLIVAVFRNYRTGAEIRDRNRLITSINGELIQNMVDNSEHYTVKVSPLNQTNLQWMLLLEEHFRGFVREEEKRTEPLNYLRLAITRWLRRLPRLSQDSNYTSLVPEFGQTFRNAITDANIEIHELLFERLPQVTGGQLVDKNVDLSDSPRPQRLRECMRAVEGALIKAEANIAQTIRNNFVPSVESSQSITLTNQIRTWFDEKKPPDEEFPFGQLQLEEVISLLQQGEMDDSAFIHKLGAILTGLELEDWTDITFQSFFEKLEALQNYFHKEGKTEIASEKLINLTISYPGQEPLTKAFFDAEESQLGQLLFANLKSSLETFGAAISVNEKRRIVLSLLKELLK